MGLAGRRAADQERHRETFTGHLPRHVHHLVQRRRDQTAEADDIHMALAGGFEDLFTRHHHAQVDHLVVVATQDDAHDVLADVVHVPLHRGHQDFALRLAAAGGLLLRLHEWLQVGHGLLHHAGALDDLRQEHLAGAEQVPDDVHPRHQRAFDHVERFRILPSRFFNVRFNIFHDALHKRMRKTLFDRALPPGVLLNSRLAFLFDGFGEGHQPLGGIRATVQQHILDQLQEVLRDLLVHRELPGVDDPQVEARTDRVIEEGGVHPLPHGVVAAERERDVADPPADLAARQHRLDLPSRLDEGHGVVVVLLDAGGDRQHVRIEDDVLWWKPNLLGQDAVRARTDLHLALDRVGLSRLVERHDDHGRAVPLDQPRMACEHLLAFFEADRVDDALALHALEPRLDHLPLGAVDHDRHAGEVRRRGDELEERAHGLFRIQHRLVHVHVDDLRAAAYLLLRDGQGAFVLAAQDQLGERGRAGNVG